MKTMARRVLSGLSYSWIRLGGRADGLRILMYHRVTDAHPESRLCVRTAAFEAQMRQLHAQGWRTVSFADAVACAQGAAPLPERAVVLTFDDGYADNFEHARPILARCGFHGIFFIPTGSVEGPAAEAADRRMSWEQVRTLRAEGHEIGAHSVTHRKLTLLPPAERAREIQECKRVLEARLTDRVEFFCYPAGHSDDAVKAAVRAAGYRGACTVEPGATRPGADPLALPRTEISGFDTLEDFDKKLAGAYDWLHRLAQAAYRCSPRSRRHPANATHPTEAPCAGS
jgi:peptidoglycan/xylan/chitin deacetylase (PgdA/CDA1 family)